jgi:16S rRNA (adenine1518-N6/adenine1519-N6)-dimethyltransferase
MIEDSLRLLPPISALLKHYNIQANKKLGQHFLFDLNITDKIVRHAGVLRNHTVIEIGPGPGALTRSILQAGPKQLIALDMDPRFIHMLEDYLLPVSNGLLTILKQDALTYNYQSISGPIRVIANLPYNISTELLFGWLPYIQHFSSLTLMLQKEVAARLYAKPNSKAYGRISILVQLACQVDLVCDISPHSFYPPPKVNSAVVQLVPHSAPPFPVNMEVLDKILRAGFNQRRKTLRASLKTIHPNASALLLKAGIDDNLRPEALSVEEFCILSRIFS